MDTDNEPLKAPVLFLEVNGAAAKKECLGILTARYFLKGWRLLLTVEGDVAATYLDQLLWTYPPEALLPHVISQKSSAERIVITTTPSANLNQAQIVFNLQTASVATTMSCQLIVELWDHAAPERAQTHWEQYQQQGRVMQRQAWHPHLADDLLMPPLDLPVEPVARVG